MTKEKIIRIVNSSLLIGSAFILCAALGMLLNPDAFYKFFSPVQLVLDPVPPSQSVSYYWDLNGYAEMALNNRCLAFYPLWPLLIHYLFHPQSVEQAAYSFLIVSTVLFFISLPLLVWVFGTAYNHYSLAFVIVLAFSLNPMAIFRVIGYTESLFTVLSTLLIWSLLPQNRLNETLRLALVFGVTFIMSLTRPILLPFVFSSVATLGTIVLFENLQPTQQRRERFLISFIQYAKEIKITFILIFSALLGYSAYGLFCLRSRGNFFAPFTDQKLWGTKLGLHLELLLFPKSPLFDLYGLYFPLLVLGIALALVYFKVKREAPLIWFPKGFIWNILFLYPLLLILLYVFNYFRLKNSTRRAGSLTKLVTSNFTQSLSHNYLFWFSIYFCVFHSLLIFFTRDRLYSLGRYTLGVPFFFLALGYLCCCLRVKKVHQAFGLWLLIGVSVIALVEQWVNYGQNRWLG